MPLRLLYDQSTPPRLPTSSSRDLYTHLYHQVRPSSSLRFLVDPTSRCREGWTSSIASPRDHHFPPLTSATAFFYACANSRTKFAALLTFTSIFRCVKTYTISVHLFELSHKKSSSAIAISASRIDLCPRGANPDKASEMVGLELTARAITCCVKCPRV